MMLSRTSVSLISVIVATFVLAILASTAIEVLGVVLFAAVIVGGCTWLAERIARVDPNHREDDWP